MQDPVAPEHNQQWAIKKRPQVSQEIRAVRPALLNSPHHEMV